MKLSEFFEKNQIKYGPWARAHGMLPSTICRHLRKGNGFALETAMKIERATGGEVSLEDLRAGKGVQARRPHHQPGLRDNGDDNGQAGAVSVRKKPFSIQGVKKFLNKIGQRCVEVVRDR